MTIHVQIYRNDQARREDLQKSLKTFKQLEIEARGGVDWVRGNVSRLDKGEYRYWSEQERIILRAIHHRLQLKETRARRRMGVLQERADLQEGLRQVFDICQTLFDEGIGLVCTRTCTREPNCTHEPTYIYEPKCSHELTYIYEPNCTHEPS